MDKLVPIIYMIGVLLLVLPSFLSSNNNLKTFFTNLSIWVAIACTLFAIAPAIFIKSKSTVGRSDFVLINAANIGNSIKDIFITAFGAFKIKPFRRIAFATFLVFNSFQVIAPFTFLIIVHYLFASDTTAAGYWPALHGSIGALITSFIVIPLITFISKKIGKKKAFIFSQLVSVIGYVLFWFLFILIFLL